MTDISALLADQPLIDESEQGGDDSQLDAIQGTGGDFGNDEPPETNTDGDGEPPQRNQKVPLAALHEERTKRQQLETEAQQLRQQQAQTLERMTKLLEAQQLAQQPQQPAEVVPSFEDDPVAAFNHVQKQLRDQQQIIQDYQQGNQQQFQAQQQHQQLTQQVSVQEQQFTQKVPDYPQAADYFYQRKVAEYAAFTGDEMAAKMQVANDYKGIAALAQRTGKNAAEMMYNAAKAMGYQAGQKPNVTQQQQKPEYSTLADAHGSARAPDEKSGLTAADVSNMSQEDFDKLWNKIARGGKVGPKI